MCVNLQDICDKITRSKMIVTLALLASTNNECARALYQILDVDICEAIDRMKATSHLDEKIADEFLLMLTMVLLVTLSLSLTPSS